MKKMIYLDNAATTKIADEVFNAMVPYLKDSYGNPSSVYSIGRESSGAIAKARTTIAEHLGASANEIYFTSGGSEADNWAIKGAIKQLSKKGKNHIITTTFEHHAVLHTVEALQKEGFEVTYIPVDEHGLVSVDEIAKAMKDTTAIVSVMYANNEIGTVQPIAQIGKLCREKGVLFHTDAVQAIGHIKIDVVEQNIDLLSLTAHKLHGPKGIGALYIRKGVRIANLIDGGAQERAKRAGTENIAGIVGFAKAVELAYTNMEEKNKAILSLRERLVDALLEIPKTRLNGDRIKRLPGNVNISFQAIEGESLLLMLDMKGICASSGSACTSGSLDPSHVLLGIGLPHEIAHGSLRLSLSDESTQEEIDYVVEQLKVIIARLRAMSPLWKE